MESKLIHSKPEEAQVQKPNLTGIPTQMKLDFERRSGLSFDDVRVHYNSDKPARLGALAYTQGNQIHVGPGQESSLPHELGHVIQQKAGRVRPTRWIGGLPVNDQPELEREADLAPVQRMPAPALWGVIQMQLPVMSAQKGCNCGYHALARALLKFQPTGTVNFPYTENDLEIYLTSYAIQTGFSVLGEAFDPDAFAHVGNQFCEQCGIPVICSVIHFQTDTDLPEILATARSDGSVILVPYLPSRDPNESVSYRPTDTQDPKVGGEHWSAIDTEDVSDSTTFKLYEGNKRGSFFKDSDGKIKTLPPIDVTALTLYNSNQNIGSEFDWLTFLQNIGGNDTNKTLSALNYFKNQVVCNHTAPNSGQFKSIKDFLQQLQQVIYKIEGPSPVRKLVLNQPSRLKGAVVKVARK